MANKVHWRNDSLYWLRGACGQRNVTTTPYHKYVTCTKCQAILARQGASR